jgi:hypothetical protein
MAIKVNTTRDSNFVERLTSSAHSKTHICDTMRNIHVEALGRTEKESVERAFEKYADARASKK